MVLKGILGVQSKQSWKPRTVHTEPTQLPLCFFPFKHICPEAGCFRGPWLQRPKRSPGAPLGDRESTLCPARQIHSSCGRSRGIPPTAPAAPLTHPSSFPRLESLTSPTATDPPKAPSAATVARSQHREGVPQQLEQAKLQLEKECFCCC